MFFGGRPYYTYEFGAMGQSLETACQTGFFRWFHLQETERRPEEPGEAVRFRPSGDKFHDLCYLDTLIAASGDLVEMELVVQRAFIDGRNVPFAQDLVKSFLTGALPEPCQESIEDFIQEIDLRGEFGQNGSTAGYRVFRGRQNEWTKKTGCSRLVLANVARPGASSFVVHIGPKPKAPKTRPIGDGSDVRWYERLFASKYWGSKYRAS